VRTEEAKGTSRSDLRKWVNKAREPAFAVDDKNIVVAWNRALGDLLEIDPKRAEKKKLRDVLKANDVYGNRLCGNNCGFHEMALGGEVVHKFTLDVAGEEGQRTRLITSVEVVPEPCNSGHHLLFSVQPDRRQSWVPENGHIDSGNGGPIALTQRQKEVLRLLAEGKSTEEIAEGLAISINTVRNHLQNCLITLGSHSRAHAVAQAIRRGLI